MSDQCRDTRRFNLCGPGLIFRVDQRYLFPEGSLAIEDRNRDDGEFESVSELLDDIGDHGEQLCWATERLCRTRF